ncbi:MAG TPA: tetratricopeptide repeat protein [Thermoflexia bacterium]|jgi:tetratricopeptide (TPR) repeat protein|nr:tetratricopeptide repeat protein [Thermoflexia bacterium]
MDHLWIPRRIADEIYERIITEDQSAVVYLIEAPAGMGKTFLARDLGTRLGSPTGYEPAQRGKIAWSGILDIYDPDTNSNQGMEQRLIRNLPQSGYEFDAYKEARTLYDAWFKGGVTGGSLEEQRRAVETAFAKGLEEIAKDWRLVFAFDTVERLEWAADPTQKEMGLFDDTASVMGWLIFQISHLRQGVVLLLGRRADRFYEALTKAVERANEDRAQNGRPPIELYRVQLGPLDEAELKEFFSDRMNRYPVLRPLLAEDLRILLARQTGGNPLLLDLALQALVETGDLTHIRQALQAPGGLKAVGRALIGAYMNLASPERQTLLRYLALARNGLFTDLLRFLEPQWVDDLIRELERMETLPFIKVRQVSAVVPGSDERVERRTYFLHDAMYTLCDEVLLTPEQVRQDSRRILTWYEDHIAEASMAQRGRRAFPAPDLLVDSLVYRMRVDPIAGYQWYLQQSDQAIRGAQTGLDMRLRDAMALFLVSASSEEEPGYSLSSLIDRANVETLFPELVDDFRLDSATQWIKRYTIRGKMDLARRVGKESLSVAEEMHRRDPQRYALPFAEFLLWYAQAEMYGYEISKAEEMYNQIVDLIGDRYSPAELAEISSKKEGMDPFDLWRLCLVLGRTYNNLGYMRWMYQGKYRRAIRDFQRAIRFFRIANLEEELANSNDNMGRVYALLGGEFRSLQLIQNGMGIRKKLRLSYREALSANSLALALLRFGRIDPALRAAEDALSRFRRAEVDRGIGLGLLTRGMIYRNLADMWREQGISPDDAMRFTDLAEADLKEAVRIFSVSVQEPIREVQAYNELACCYRARHFLLIYQGASESEQEIALAQGRTWFRRAIKAATEHNYTVEELDSLQDLAVLTTRAGQYEEAERHLEEIRGKIPDEYKIREGVGLAEVPEADRVDAYYRLMGQVELLAGAIAFERGRIRAGSPNQPAEIPDREALLETARHYLLAVCYFNEYSGETFVNRLTYARIYRRFQGCPPDLVREITQEHFPRWIEEYRLPPELAQGLFQDVFGLF